MFPGLVPLLAILIGVEIVCTLGCQQSENTLYKLLDTQGIELSVSIYPIAF